jgi:hypothetical protein
MGQISILLDGVAVADAFAVGALNEIPRPIR